VEDSEIVELLLIRHADAVPRGTPGIADADRALTGRGKKQFRDAAKGLARLIRPRAVLTSPLRRARETAEIACRAWAGPRPREVEALADYDLAALRSELERFSDSTRVALVGHEPHFSRLLAHLLAGTDAERLTFRKGGAALVEVDGPGLTRGSLLWYVPPKVLARISKK